MAISWDEVAQKVKVLLERGLSYVPPSKITIINSIDDYFANNTAQTSVDDVVVLISPPQGGPEHAEPLIGGMFRKRYDLQIAIVSKIDPNAVTRIWGSAKKGIFDMRADIVSALEHRNLDGFVDNKSGSNFEVPWSMLPLDGRAFTGYSTVYTVIKTER